jgi:DNA-binding NarL/FixJ family response regulator
MKEADAKLAALKAATVGPATIAVEQPILAAPPAAVPEARPRAAKSDNLELPPDPRHADVYRMADQGNSPNEIARQLNRPHGEVELILALRPQ